jgi:hypothetical protein
VQQATTQTEVLNLIKHDEAIQHLILQVDKYGISAKTVTAALAGEADQTAIVTVALGQRREELVKTIAAHTLQGQKSGAVMDEQARKAQAEVAEIDKLSGSFGKTAEKQTQAAKAAGLYTEAAQAAKAGAAQQAAAFAAQAAETEKLGSSVLALGKNFAPLVDVVGLLTDKTLSGKDVADIYGKSIKDIGVAAIPAGDALAQYGIIADTVAESQQNASQRGDAFKSILAGVAATAGPTGSQVDILTKVFQDAGTAELTASDRASLLRQAWQQLYQPAIDQTNATQNFNQALFGLKDSLDKSSTSLDINKAAGITNRQAVEALIAKNNDLYFANIAAGDTAEVAGEKHRIGGEKILEAGRKAGLTDGEVRVLNAEYGKIPPVKDTKVTITGANAVYQQLIDLKIAQLALATNVDVATAGKQIHNQMGFGIGGLAMGGPIFGPGTGTSDSILARLSAGEHVWTAKEVAAAGGHSAVEAIRQLVLGRSPRTRYPGDGSAGIAFAEGGAVWPFPIDVSHTKIPYTLKELQDKFGGGDAMVFLKAQVGKPYIWASAGPAGYDCSGIVSAVWNVIHKRSPYLHTFSTMNEAPYFPLDGVGGVLSAGWSNPGDSGPGGDSVGHTAGILAGVPFESTGGVGVRIGSGVTAIGRFRHVGHFGMGGVVPGPTGRAQPAIVHGGERITPPGMATRLDEYTISRIVQALQSRPVQVEVSATARRLGVAGAPR